MVIDYAFARLVHQFRRIFRIARIIESRRDRDRAARVAPLAARRNERGERLFVALIVRRIRRRERGRRRGIHNYDARVVVRVA